ncbi:MAG TPA: chemotaxis protein CheW [Nitrospirae bacterium]|nr:chemotaxis protein CheW [bacterium BMS3Abin06]HDH13212.1 chemotaxis protein CheW [Nitrospirota bacterium]HDL20419.1 chemotaxis protein CheW [Nitrospirota bacterium]HDZ01820.1 chemotaxis protein CheW [Nitrospirota bacterium]
METSTVTEQVLQLVTFTLANEEYAVDILNVQEINRTTEITNVPNAPGYVEGVVNLRGRVIPVINLRKKFGLPEKNADDTTRIIIMDIQGVTNGLIVDSVSEVLRIPSDIVEPSPPVTSNTSRMFIKGIAKLEKRLIILIDIDKLMGEAVQL